jgi:hypothetical protein
MIEEGKSKMDQRGGKKGHHQRMGEWGLVGGWMDGRIDGVSLSLFANIVNIFDGSAIGTRLEEMDSGPFFSILFIHLSVSNYTVALQSNHSTSMQHAFCGNDVRSCLVP